MATCRHCAYLRKCIEKATKDGYEHNVDFDPKDGCTGIGFKSNTNADRIRAMSDGELADWMAEKFVIETCLRLKDQGYEPTETQKAVIHRTLYHTWLKWLKQPAEDQL